MDKKNTKITCEGDPLYIRIFIDDALYLYVDKQNMAGLQSWYVNNYDLKIAIYLKLGGPILLEFNSVFKWKAILKLINENI